MRNEYKILVGKPEWGRWEDYIKLDYKETVLKCKLNSSGPMAGSCEHSNESSCSIKGGKFLD